MLPIIHWVRIYNHFHHRGPIDLLNNQFKLLGWCLIFLFLPLKYVQTHLISWNNKLTSLPEYFKVKILFFSAPFPFLFSFSEIFSLFRFSVSHSLSSILFLIEKMFWLRDWYPLAHRHQTLSLFFFYNITRMIKIKMVPYKTRNNIKFPKKVI